ncbi:MAG: hypothetical protein ICV78_28185 [Tolypothrix sp. Co-bin9]|nr:hypothetical protein [Tolypothrix sp. Co-bin9]
MNDKDKRCNFEDKRSIDRLFNSTIGVKRCNFRVQRRNDEALRWSDRLFNSKIGVKRRNFRVQMWNDEVSFEGKRSHHQQHAIASSSFT